MTELLTEVSYGRVHGRFILPHGANTDPDDDADDVKPAKGYVTFTPLVEAVQFPTSTPPVTVVPMPVVCELDDEGYVVDDERRRGVWLVATDDEDGLPNLWGYKVKLDISGIKAPRIFNISVPAGGEVDLASGAPPAESALVSPSLADAIFAAVALGATNDSLTAALVENAGGVGPLTSAALSATYARSLGAGVARFITRARAGGSLKIVGVGDSVTAGTGATLGTNDYLTLVKNACDAQFAATITQSNRALSGATVATNVINGYFANAIADSGDLYIISFGKNDTVADTVGVPRQGYPRANSIRGLEVMVREIQRNVPQADIIIASENPNIAADTGGNANLVLWNAQAQQIADAYGCEWVDVYGDWIARGSYSALLSDSVHPSVAGHAAIAGVIMDHIPAAANVISSAAGSSGSVDGVTDVAPIRADVGFNGWRVIQSTDAVQDGVWVNSGTWSGSNPYVTSTATDFAEMTFVGTELMVRFSTSAADAAVVDIAIDGVTVHSGLALSALASNFQPFLLVASGLSQFQHKVKITLVSGTLRIYQAAWLVANIPAAVPHTARKLIGARYYGQQPYAPATTAPAAGTATVVPIYVPVLKTLNQIAIDVTTLQASSTVALGIYGSDEYDQPLGLIVDGGTVASDTTGFKTVTVTKGLTPGWYWLVALSLGAAPAMRSNTATHDLVTTSAASTASALNGYTATGLSALPKRWTSTSAGANSPRILARFT